MLSSDLKSRIADLKRSALRRRHVDPVAVAAPVRVADIPPSVIPRATATDARIKLSLSDVAKGRDKVTPAGRFFLIDRGIEELIPRKGPVLAKRFVELLRSLQGQAVVPNDTYETFQDLSRTRPESLAFVDIEATGFTPGTPLFLVGLVIVEDNVLRIRQLLARDYTEEGALLFHLRGLIDEVDTIVSFNGKTYDLPYIRDRMVYHGYRLREGIAHIDLLHEGHRRYKDRLVNCKLQTLERVICGRGRDDIPGFLIPDAYHNFVRTGNAVEIRDILRHNALDLVTMVEVVLFMLEGRTL